MPSPAAIPEPDRSTATPTTPVTPNFSVKGVSHFLNALGQVEVPDSSSSRYRAWAIDRVMSASPDRPLEAVLQKYSIPPAQFEAEVERLATVGNDFQRSHAIEFVVGCPDLHHLLPSILATMEEEFRASPEFRPALLAILAEVQNPQALPLLRQILSDCTSTWGRVDAAEYIAEYPGCLVEAIEAISRELGTPGYESAEEALGKFAERWPMHGAASKDPANARIIELLKAGLAIMVDTTDYSPRSLCRIGSFGPSAREHLPLLVEAMEAGAAGVLRQARDKKNGVQNDLDFVNLARAISRVAPEIGAAAEAFVTCGNFEAKGKTVNIYEHLLSKGYDFSRVCLAAFVTLRLAKDALDKK